MNRSVAFSFLGILALGVAMTFAMLRWHYASFTQANAAPLGAFSGQNE